jgi:putative flavoprotein involved in K+ transport
VLSLSTRPEFRLADGGRVETSAVVAATGYRCALANLVGHLGVLNERGVPPLPDRAATAPRLYFVGFTPVPGQIRRVSLEVHATASAIARRR